MTPSLLLSYRCEYRDIKAEQNICFCYAKLFGNTSHHHQCKTGYRQKTISNNKLLKFIINLLSGEGQRRGILGRTRTLLRLRRHGR